jgi:hypothetical protein
MENKTHFRKLLNPLYLGSHDLEPDKEYKVTFERIDRDVEVIGEGGKKQKKPVAHFKGASKPMILNATNLKMSVIIKVVQERSFGEMMDVIRILNKKP